MVNSMIKKKKRRKCSQLLSVALVNSTFLTPAHSMTDDDWQNHNWSALFTKAQVGPKILDCFDNRTLGRTAQVSTSLRQRTHQMRQTHIQREKTQLYCLILEVTLAEPNEVQRAHDRLDAILKIGEEKGEQSIPFYKTLQIIKPRLVQPESLIRANDNLVKQLVATQDLKETHPALKPLVTLIKNLQELSENDRSLKTQEFLKPLIHHYVTYQQHLLSPQCDRTSHLHPKALLSGEGFLGNGQGFTSYRISQDMARFLLSKDEYGLCARTNAQGSHSVSFKRSHQNKIHGVHFKGNTTNSGLPVGREFAMYALSETLFIRGDRFATSALLSLNEVEISTPPEGTEVYRAFNEAVKEGKTSEEFFAHFPHYEREFTQKNPTHILQAGSHVEGLSMEDFTAGAEVGIYTYEDIDLTSFSEHIILSMLTNPSDGTPGNFIIRTDLGKPYPIIGIDNDMALELGDVFSETVKEFKLGQKGVKVSKKHNVRVKNILMCLPLMNRALSPSTVKRILNLNPELCALQWLEYLKQQHLRYLQLEQGKYMSDSSIQRQRDYLSPAQLQDLHLPFLLDADFIPQFCQKIKKIQTYLEDHMAATHWQLLLNVHPLSSRFYQEIIKQEEGSAIGAYLKIDPRYKKHDPNIPKRKVIYLEDILDLEEKLLNGQTIEETLKDITCRSDGTIKFAQSIDEAAKVLLSMTDLFSQPLFSDFLKSALEGFGNLIQSSTKLDLCNSWNRDILLLKAISSSVLIQHIEALLELGLDVSITDGESRTAIRYVVENGAYHEWLPQFIKAYKGPHFLSWLNRKASDRLTALDIAMERKHTTSFIELINAGASVCEPTIALKFSKDVIKTTKDLVLQETFHKLMNLNDQIKWSVCLDAMLPPYVSGQHGTAILTANYGKRLLPNWVKDQILDSNNQWIPYTQDSNHIVCRATMPGTEHALYFKVYPELPGIEEAVGLFTRKLIGYGAPHTELMQINGVPVLLSHSHGDKTKTLEVVLKNKPEILKNLDEESLSALILVAMLINPEDGKPSNYVIEPHPTKSGKYRIVGIDNDHAFVPAVVKEKPDKEFLTGKPIPVAQVKTILYCLDQMREPVHNAVMEFFVNLNPAEILDEWLRELKKINVSYSALFTEKEEQVELFEKHESFVGIPFQSGAISHLYDKFVTLRNILRKYPDITHMDLLGHLEPLLAKRYEEAVKLTSVQERWECVDAGFYEKTKTGSSTTMTRSSHVLKSMNIPLKKSIFESIRDGEELGPIQALQELVDIKKELDEKFLEELGARAGDPNFLQTLRLELTRAKFLEKTDFKNLPMQEQESILTYLQNKQLRDLTLKNCVVLNDNILTKSLTLNHLVKLDIRGCEGITYQSLMKLESLPLLEELNLSGIKSLKEIGNIGVFTDTPLVFNKLRFLNVSYCINLIKLLIQAPELHYLNVENCVHLTTQMLEGVIKGSKKLQKLVCEGCSFTNEDFEIFKPKQPKIISENIKEESIVQRAEENTLEENLRDKSLTRALEGIKEKDSDFILMPERIQTKIPKDHYIPSQTMEWYKEATSNGDDFAMYSIGYLYEHEKRDYANAMEWYLKAAAKENTFAMNSIGSLYCHGRGVPLSYDKAMEWYLKAVDEGNAFAMNNIGLLYCQNKSYGEALKWLKKASANGNDFAMNNIGSLYCHGLGVPQDYTTAMRWYVASADRGNYFAMNNIIYLYHNNLGVPRDDTKVVEWHSKANNSTMTIYDAILCYNPLLWTGNSQYPQLICESSHSQGFKVLMFGYYDKHAARLGRVLGLTIPDRYVIGCSFAALQRYNYYFQFWLCAEQERFDSTVKMYLRDAMAVVFFVNCSNPSYALDILKHKYGLLPPYLLSQIVLLGINRENASDENMKDIEEFCKQKSIENIIYLSYYTEKDARDLLCATILNDKEYISKNF